jgi:hypothetical protein
MHRAGTLLACGLACVAAAGAGTGGAQAASHLSRERKVEASIVLTLTPPSPGLLQTSTIELFVPERFRDAGAQLPHCNTSVLLEKRPEACPKRSIVGGGTSFGYTILGGQFVQEHLALTIFNGPHASLLTWVEGHSPVVIETAVQGVITKPPGYGQELAFTIPHDLLEPIPGAPGWLQTLNARLSGKAGWLRTTSCPEHPWSLRAQFGYTNGQEFSLQTRLACV